jgi:hypothetical protein
MEYRIEAIGAEFSDKAADQLADHLTAQAQAGWKLHSVFQAQQPGCLGIGSPTITYFAIYVRD